MGPSSLWKEWLEEQDDLFYPGPRPPVESNSDSGRDFVTHKPSASRPAVARALSITENLEEIVVRPGFQLPDIGRVTSPAYDVPREVMAEAHSPHQPTSQSSKLAKNSPLYDIIDEYTPYEQHHESCGCTYHQIDGDKRVAVADAAAKPDVYHAGYDVVGRINPQNTAVERERKDRVQGFLNSQEGRREDGGRRKNPEHMQVQVVSENQVQLKIVTFRGAPAGEEDEEWGTERASGLTGAGKATAVGRSSAAGTMADDAAKSITPPSAPFCIFEGKRKKNKQKRQRIGEPRLDTAAANDDVAIAEYPLLTAEEKQTIEEWKPGLETAKQRVVVADPPVPVADNKSEAGGCGFIDCSAGQDGSLRCGNYIFKALPAAEKVPTHTSGITKALAAGKQLASANEETESGVARKMVNNRKQELWVRFSLFDRLATQLNDLGGGRAELDRMLTVLKRIRYCIEDFAYFAREHRLLDEDSHKKNMQDMVDAMQLRQKSLWALGVKVWDVSQFSDEYWRILKGEAARASEMAKENSGQGCVGHCWWHSPSECMDDDDVFQD